MGKKKNKNKKGEDQVPATPPVVEEQVVKTSDAPFKYDEFWLAKGKESVENSISGLQDRIQLFYNFLNTLSASTLIGSAVLLTLTGTKNWKVFVLVFSAIFLLQVAKYIISIWLTKPKYQEIDLRSPIQINKAHNNLVTSLRSNLSNGKIVVLVATLLYIVLVGLALFINNTLEKPILNKTPTISIFSDQIKIDGLFKEDKEMKLLLIGEAMKLKDSLSLGLISKDSLKVKDTLKINMKVLKDKQLQYHFHKKDLSFKLKKVVILYPEEGGVKMIEKENQP